MTRTPVYIICSPRAFVGKTLIARLLTEFLALQRGAVEAFDVNLKEPSLLDYLPAYTETAEVEDTIGKIALMDRLIVPDGIGKVVDLGVHAFDEFFTMIGQIGFLKEAARQQVAPQILFVAGIDRVSGRGYDMLRAIIPPPALLTIANEYVLHGELPAIGTQDRVLPIAELPNFLKTYIDRVSFSFTGYLRAEKDSSTELHQWIRDNYYSFRELELSLAGR